MNKKQYAAATQRNREPIVQVLSSVLPPQGDILEIASGTGEHALFFASHLYPRQWLPSDPNPLLRDSIAAWREEYQGNNLLPPLDIDATSDDWNMDNITNFSLTAIANINMIHIAPWRACLGLLTGAERLLPSGGILYLYGPYKVHGKHTSESNLAFDEMLQAQNPEWGVRDLEAVVEAANQHQLIYQQNIPMPANNFSVIFRKVPK